MVAVFSSFSYLPSFYELTKTKINNTNTKRVRIIVYLTQISISTDSSSSTLGLVFDTIPTGLEPLLCCRPFGTMDGMIALIVCLASIIGIRPSNSDGGGVRIANDDDARFTYRLISVTVVQSLIQ